MLLSSKTAWDDINVGFDASEETINFGTRAIAQSDTDIYETNTVATIKATNEDLLNKKPICETRYSAAGVGVAIDNSWILFNGNFSEVKLKISFDSNIETFEISEDGYFLFIALEDSSLKCIFLEFGGVTVFNTKIDRPLSFKGKAYFSKIISMNINNSLEVYIIVNTGKTIRVQGIDFNSLKQIIKNENSKETLINNLPIDADLKLIHTMESSIQNMAACRAITNDDTQNKYKLWLCGDYVYIWTAGDNEDNSMIYKCIPLSENQKIKKLCSSISGDKMIGLTVKGSLVFFCPFTYLTLGTWSNAKVVDFTFITHCMDDHMNVQIMLLIDFDTPELWLCDVKGFSLKVIFQLPLDSLSTYLVQDQINCEDTLFIDGYMENGKVNAMRIKSICISQPEFRLERFLQRGKFKEAEDFAKIFSLDIELVYKAKIKWLMSRLQLWNKIPLETLDSNFNELYSLLKKLKDVEFVAECCLKTVAPKLSKIQQLLEYAIDRITTTSTKTENLQRLLGSLGVSLRTLVTFMLVCCGEAATPDKWLIFSTANPISLCKQHLSRGEVKEAIIICSRHHRKMKDELTESMAVSLFEILPLSVTVQDTINWYECYVPLLLVVHPHTLVRLTRRIIDKAKRLELSESDNWPDISVTFLTDMITLLEKLLSLDDSSPKGVALNQGKYLPDSPINQLRNMVTKLEKLYILKHNHSILVSYDTFANQYGAKDLEEFVQLTSLLFENVPIEGISSLIKDFAEPYCVEHYRDIDYIISHYVIDTVKSYSRCWDVESTLWELRCIAFINCIRSTNEKMKVTEVIIRNAKVPWSAEVNEIAQKAVQVKHPLAQTILNHSYKVSKKIILNKYDLLVEWVDSPDMTILLPYIFKQGQRNTLKDALDLIGSVDKLKCYECFIHHCIQENKMFEIMNIFKSLDYNEIVEFCDRILYSATMNFKKRSQNCEERYLEVLPAISTLLSKFSKNNEKDRTKYIEAAYKLKKEYGIAVDSSELTKYQIKELILKNCLFQIINEDIEKYEVHNEERFIKSWAHLSRNLTRLLELPRDLEILQLIDICCKAKNIHLACNFLKLLNENSQENIGSRDSLFHSHGHLLRKILLSVLPIISNSVDVSTEDVNIICTASDLLVIEGKPQDLALNTDLNNACRLLHVPPPKPSWCMLYDAAESYRFPLPHSICENISHCLNNISVDESNQNLQEEVERTLQDMPKDLLSLGRMCNLTTILTKNRMIELRTIKKAKNITIQTVSAVLLKVVKSRQLDMALSLGLLQFFQPDKAIKWLENVSNISLEMRHGRSLGLVGKQYCKLYGFFPSDNSNTWNYFERLHQTSKWGLKLQQYGIPGKEAYKEDLDSKQNVLLRLMSIPGADLPLLREYCTDMNLNMEECLLIYLKFKLLSWKPRFIITTNPITGKTEPVFEKDDEFYMTCVGIALQITNKKNLINFLNINVWNEINPYHYEVYLVILDILAKSDYEDSEQLFQQNSILHFLKSYNRISACQEDESDSWFSMFPSSASLPTIAKYRLPFQSKPYDVQSLIPELSLETYNLWIQAPLWPNNIPDTNMICLYSIQNLKGKDVSHSNGWILHERKRDLLNSITQCIDRITNLEIAGAAWYFVVNHVMPPGIDQVHAAQKCLLKAEEWKTKEKSDRSKLRYIKAEKKYFTVSTVHILYKYRLAKQEYLSLVAHPAELISQLYQDPCITDNFNVATPSNMPNINEAVERISSLHNINLTFIIQELLTEWLQPDNCLHASFIETTTTAANIQNQLPQTDNIIRACYVLLGCKELQNAENFLLGLAFPRNHDDTSKPVGVRLRALQVLTAITSTQYLEEITSRDKESIGNYMTVLSLLYELDRLGIGYTIGTFELVPKENVINLLLNRTNATGIKLAARITLTYNIIDSHIWNSLLKQMTKYAMVPELEALLSEVDYLQINRKVLSSAWNCVILSTLARGERVNSEEAKTIAEKSFKMVTSCPVFSYLDLTSIISYFRKFQRFDLADILENISTENC
uniref:Putative kinetochore component n=2 Tax=Triatoma infestans TaxID=30076 RepID=A0A023F032_TRIIF